MTKKPLFYVFIFILLYNLLILFIIRYTHVHPEIYSIQTNHIVDYWMKFGIVKSRFIPTIIASNQYYLSHPPLSYYALYFFEKMTGLKSYYVLNAILVSVSALFIYLTISLLNLKKAKNDFSLFAWAGMILYLFSYPVLRFQYFNYHPDIFVLTGLIIAQYLFLKLVMKGRYRSVKYMVWIAMMLFIVNYSSWFGVFFTFILCIVALFNIRKGYKLFPFMIMAVMISVFSILLTYTQYAVFGGWDTVIHYFKDTYWRESPLYGHIRQTLSEIIYHLIQNLGVFIVSLLILVYYSFFGKKKRFLFTKNGYKYIIISLLPVFIYSVFLIQYFQNSFACLYFMPPLIVSICIWLEKLFHQEKSPFQLIKIVLLIVISNLSLFFVL